MTTILHFEILENVLGFQAIGIIRNMSAEWLGFVTSLGLKNAFFKFEIYIKMPEETKAQKTLNFYNLGYIVADYVYILVVV